ncbi:ABC transporter ATP-binding protein [Alphaproteobacteria bacterium]|nr:ABC transporter ATP-binding protein [Alphaproteobacteria bacterium]
MSILSLNNVNTFYGKSHILQGITFDLKKPGCLALLGRNGAGKTTTLRSIVNLTRPSSGKISFSNNSLMNLSTYKIAKLGLTLVPENRGMFSSLSVEESLNIVDTNFDNIKWNKERVLETFPQLKLKLRNNSSSLSGGEQQMLAIGKALLTNPKLILLDEPTQGLAPNIVIQLTDILKDIIKEGISIIIVEQNVNMALKIANHVVIIGKGITKWKGNKETFLNNIQKHKEWIGI